MTRRRDHVSSRMRLAVLGLFMLTVALPLSGAANAQVQPPPQEAQPVLEAASPVVRPACGNALLAASFASGVVPPEVSEALEIATANAFVICGSIPTPTRAPTRCADSAVVAEVMSQLSGALVGGVLPLAPPSLGQAIDALRALQKLAPVPADDEGAVGSAAAALSCTSPVPPRPPSAPGAEPDATLPAPAPAIGPESAASAAAATSPASIGPLPDGVGPPLLAATSAGAGAGEPPSPRSVDHPIFLLPVLVLVGAAILVRGLVGRTPPGAGRARVRERVGSF